MIAADLWEAAVADPFDLDLDDESAMRSHAIGVATSGGAKTECPVAPSHPQWSAWQLAWSRTRSESEQRSGAMGTRTRLMKAEVRRQMEHLPEYGPDPAAEVTEPRRGVNLVGGSITLTILASTSAFQEAIRAAAERHVAAFQEAVDSMNAVFTAAGTDLQGLLAQIQEIDAEPDLQRLRHGSAATCPRHGVTKGGTCMKCARGRS